jgi:hypothetical protein
MGRMVTGTGANGAKCTGRDDTAQGAGGQDGADIRNLAFDPRDEAAGSVTFIDGATPLFRQIEDCLSQEGVTAPATGTQSLHPRTTGPVDPAANKPRPIHLAQSTEMDHDHAPAGIPSFGPGALIQTDKGEMRVEDIIPGHRLITRDRGYRPVVWVGQTHITASMIAAQPELAPVKIRQGALGRGLPAQDMAISPQHRLLVHGPRTKLLFGENEVLVPAAHLVGYPGITRETPALTTYVHLMCERHEIILADGTWTESFQPADLASAGLDAAQYDEIMTIFPNLHKTRPSHLATRRTLQRHEADLLLA